jgi:RNA polymerase primary sigma factor
MAESTGWSDDDPLQVYLAEVRRVPPLDKAEEVACTDHVRAGDEMAESAARRLVEANLHFVVSLAQDHQSGQDILDLIQRGNEGLLRAVHSLTDCVPESFSAHATPFINEALAGGTVSILINPSRKE